MVPITITGRDDRITSRHKAHAQEKVSKLSRYFDGIVQIEVLLGHGPTDAEAELVIAVRGGKSLVSSAKGADLYAAIDVVIDKAEVQLTRHKEKLQAARKGPSARRGEVGAQPEPEPPSDEEAYQDIVEKRKFP